MDTCRHCNQPIHTHTRGDYRVWLHSDTNLMLCQPDEEAPDFTGEDVAEPKGG